jgi:DNA polymerase V
LTLLVGLIKAVSQFATRAAETLRKHDSRAGQVMCFIRISPFRRDDKQYSRLVTVPLRRSKSDAGPLMTAAEGGQGSIPEGVQAMS